MKGLESKMGRQQSSVDTGAGLKPEDLEMRREVLGNEIFHQYVQNALLNNFVSVLEEVDIPEEQIRDVRRAISGLSSEEIVALCSLPHELREVFAEKFKKEIESGRDVAVVVKDRAINAVQYGFDVGFHTSPVDISPSSAGEWVIKGTEKDHRDDDLTMAYYSSQYRHLFKKKNPKFVYVVRTEKGHRTDGNWSRAPSLSIVMRLPFSEVYDYVERSIRGIDESVRSGEREGK